MKLLPIAVFIGRTAMNKYKVVETFLSIYGEGAHAGELAFFIRLHGCNLKCSWCDTTYSWNNEIYEILSLEDILKRLEESGAERVTLTGGEPLIHEGIDKLVEGLCSKKKTKVQIETNGSISVEDFRKNILSDNLSFVLDYKLPKSNMTSQMDILNFENLKKEDVYKFVVADKYDLDTAYEIIEEKNLTKKCKVHLSLVPSELELSDIVDYMKAKNWNGVRLQPQLHKIIWSPQMRGV